MAQCLLNLMTGGVSKSLLEQVTAGAADVLKDKVIVDKNGNPLTGTMPNNGSWDTEVGIGASVTIPKGYHDGTGVAKNSTTNRGAWNGTVAVNGSVTIPAGYHNGSGKVTNTTSTMNGQTITPKASQQTVSCSGKYMTGNIVIQGDSDLVAGNILSGKNIFGVAGNVHKYASGGWWGLAANTRGTKTGFGFTPITTHGSGNTDTGGYWTAYDSYNYCISGVSVSGSNAYQPNSGAAHFAYNNIAMPVYQSSTNKGAIFIAGYY